ncbi:EAL and HDOD domain-containing protein [Legionella worsleiensis]|uniref:Signal transduction protein n=1 Tax=Legionella worsleiensis TaxID=45076 RepID=A0A0W1AFG1_9GAMM|nr:HDOD domain-containing protein [Legionella worsleiensis]KTD80030.1 signal transduction protein [Legionella worsleiensis]STY32502.1 signal transduction protein [Legionella worsleiensis]
MIIKRPIFNQQLKCVAYEILSHQNQQSSEELTKGFLDLITSSDTQLPLFIPYALKIYLEQLDPPLKNPIILKLPAEDIESIYSLSELQESAFSIALLINKPQQLAWLNFAEYVALTDHLMNQSDVTKVVQYSKLKRRKVIAYDIGRPASFEKCKAMTMDYYCGDFLFHPSESGQKDIAANKLNFFQLIQRVQKDDCDFNDISALIQSDPLLSYQILRVANSIGISGGHTIESIDQAIARFGLINLKNWVMLFSMKNISDKPVEILESALIRAYMTRALAETSAHINGQSAYTAGLLSILDCLLNKPMCELIEHITLSEDIKMALIDKKGTLGQLLSLVVAYEQGQWEEVNAQNYNGVDMSKLYIDSLALITDSSKAMHD